jgi:tripartite-type tricarboxylate transporter receptor subunit TctC
MRTLILVFGFAVSFISAGSVTAQTYPSRPITVVVTFPAGGPSDTIMRIVAEGMRGSLGQPVIIENVAGAAGSLGTARVARAATDGYTVVLGDWGTHVVNGAIYTLSYDVVRDFEPVALMTTNPALIIAKKAMPQARRAAPTAVGQETRVRSSNERAHGPPLMPRDHRRWERRGDQDACAAPFGSAPKIGRP